MKLIYNPTCTIHSNIVSDIEMAKEAEYDGIEILMSKLNGYLDSGLTLDYLKKCLNGFPVQGIGFVEDIERQGEEHDAVMAETERICQIASELNCPNVQILTGPLAQGTAGNPMYADVKVSPEYEEFVKKDWKEIRKITGKAVAEICDIGAKYGIRFYLEPLGWTPVGPLNRGLEVLEEAGRDNVGLIIDFWHMYVTDTTPDDVAKLDKKCINGAHFCDSLKKPDSGVIDQSLRDVYPGHGVAPIKEYVEALKATGYDDWIAGECFSTIHTYLEGYDVAYTMKKYMEYALY